VLTAPALSLLTVSTVRLDAASTGGRALLELLPEAGALAWVQDGQGLVGWGEAARLELTGPGRFLEAQAWWDALVGRAVVTDDVRRPGTGLVAFGSFAFDPATGSSVLVVPEVVVGHRGDDWWITTVGRPAPGDRLPAREPVRPPSSVVFSDGAVSGVDWMSAVQEAVAKAWLEVTGCPVCEAYGLSETSPGVSANPTDTDAWFAAYAPARRPRVAISVMLVGQGTGGATAAPVAKQVLEAALRG